MVIEQFLPAFHDGDATSNSALAFHRFLESRGIESRLITLTSDESVRDRVTLFEDYQTDPRSLKILHFAIPSPLTDFFRETGGKKVMIYHNITPSRYFTEYSEFLTRFTADGRAHLKTLADSFDLSVGVSEFNADDLRKLNFRNVRVFPLFINLKDYEQPHSRAFYQLIEDERKNILCAGRVAPNKMIEDAVKALFFYKKYLSPSIRLIVAGNTGSVPRYFSAVRDLASRFYLTPEDILFTGHIRFDEFLAVYRISDVYLSMSDHEGFCLPVMESFKMDLPVAAYDAGAIRETVGKGGIVFDSREPEKVAGILEYMIENSGTREKLISSGRRRLAEYEESSEPDQLLTLLESI